MESLLQRCLPPLKLWAHGACPPRLEAVSIRDLVQEAALHVLGNLATFEPRHVGAMQLICGSRDQPDLRRGAAHRTSASAARASEDHPSDVHRPPEDSIPAKRTSTTRRGVRPDAKDRAPHRPRASKCSGASRNRAPLWMPTAMRRGWPFNRAASACRRFCGAPEITKSNGYQDRTFGFVSPELLNSCFFSLSRSVNHAADARIAPAVFLYVTASRRRRVSVR